MTPRGGRSGSTPLRRPVSPVLAAIPWQRALASRGGSRNVSLTSPAWYALLAALALTLLWRVPSFFDPPWVNDEGTYFAVAQAMAHGYRLYAGIWENKPPALYLLYLAIWHLAGPTVVALRAAATVAVAGIVLLTVALARSFTGSRAGAAAGLFAGLIFGIPFLEGTTANAEVFLALASAAGVYLTLGRRQPALGGVLMVLALSFKAVGAFDAAILGLWLLRYDRRAFVPYAAAVAAGVAAMLALAGAAGILTAMIRDAFLYDLGYVGHANGGALPWLAILKVVLLLALTVILRRRPFPVLWLLWALAGALISGRLNGHYFLQAAVPFVLVVTLIRPSAFARSRALLVLVVLAVIGAAISTLAGDALAAGKRDTMLDRRLQYYANFARFAGGIEPYAWYRAQVDDHVTRNLGVAATLRAGPPGPVLVWANTPWVYPLSGHLPATPYTSAWRAPPVPGELSTLRRALARGIPRQVVVVEPALPPLGPATSSLRAHYRLERRVGNALIYRRR